MYCHPANNVLQYDGAYWIRTNKAMPLRVLAHQCHLTLMPQIKYGELPRVLLLRRMHSAFLAVRGLDTISVYLLTQDFKSVSPATQDRVITATPDSNRLTFDINNCR
jgi:hypothetical protein